ncbi:hypothetical protein Cob_v002178 [Colletotrichum orbiculare MAFF 240422]|uniref:Uncharacterized protein n=1 Tax=Colletotrichum orbiculare (strain 104-T / ATCC 96160 / CBS 514.97 / LARS 414 / MAFF 240422) TaxID=1213857 RepID=A0A484G499_COLOR|nr:hypothetical protein Cob_v002178 [Colletotrichum orbiculare MAFF 240422]
MNDAFSPSTALATFLSLYLPSLRARLSPTAPVPPPSLLSSFGSSGGFTALNWRQVALSGAVAFWALRLGSYLFQRILQDGNDSRFDEIKKSPVRFGVAFFAQATWVSLCLLPVIALNSVPATAFAVLPAVRGFDVLGLLLYAGGFTFEVAADRQKSRWIREKRAKVHDEEFMTKGLWSRSQYPNYFGEISLWTGIATAATGNLLTYPVQKALGFSGGLAGRLGVAALSFISPAFVCFLLLKVSGIPLSENKYDKRYGDRKDYQDWKRTTPKLVPKVF